MLIFNKFGSHELESIVTDVAGNRSTMKFKINTKPQLGFIKRPLHENFAQHMQYHHENEFSAQGFLIQIPDSALYNDIDFKYSTSPHPKRRWSNIHYAHTDHTPLHKKAEIYIKCNFPSDIPTDNLIAIRKTSDGKVRVHVGKYAACYYYFKSKYFAILHLS